MAYRSSISAQGASNTAASCAAPAGTVAGDRLVAVFTYDQSSVISLTATGWTQLDQRLITTLDGQLITLFERVATGSDTLSLTYSGTSGSMNWTIQVVALSGRHVSDASTFAWTAGPDLPATPATQAFNGLTATANADLVLFDALDTNFNSSTFTFSVPASWDAVRQTATPTTWSHLSMATRDNVSAGATGTISQIVTRTVSSDGFSVNGFVVNVPEGASGPVTGTLAVTEGADTLVGLGGQPATPAPYLGWFDGELRNDAWFDAELQRAAWWDTEIVNSASGSGVTGTLGVTEGADTVSGAGTISGGTGVTGTLGVTESGDTAAAAGAIIVGATAARAEAADTAAATGTILVGATAARTEAGDTAAGTGAITLGATGAATEAGDTAAGTGAIIVGATSATSEAGDTLSAVGNIGSVVVGTLGATEAADTGAGTSAVALAGTGAGTEGADTVAGTGSVIVGATAARAEAGDTGSGTGVLIVSATGTTTEAGDTVAGTGAIGSVVTGTLAATEGADTAAGTSAVALAGTSAATEGADTSTGAGGITVSAAGAATDVGDTLAGLGIAQSSTSISPTRANLIYELALLHGLVPGSPLTVSATARSAGALTQSITGTDTVTITTTSSDVLHGDLDTWIDALAAVHGLTAPLVVTATARTAGALVQTLTNDGTTTTVETP